MALYCIIFRVCWLQRTLFNCIACIALKINALHGEGLLHFIWVLQCIAVVHCCQGKGWRMKKEWVKLKTAVNMAAAMEVLTFMSFLFICFVFFCSFCLFCCLFLLWPQAPHLFTININSITINTIIITTMMITIIRGIRRSLTRTRRFMWSSRNRNPSSDTRYFGIKNGWYKNNNVLVILVIFWSSLGLPCIFVIFCHRQNLGLNLFLYRIYSCSPNKLRFSPSKCTVLHQITYFLPKCTWP